MSLLRRGKDKDEEQSELHSQIKPKIRPKKDPIERVKQRQREFTERIHQDYKPQEYGLKLWWVMHFDKDGKDKYDGPCYSAWEADRKLATYSAQGFDGEMFELRNIDTERKAKEEIKRILKERQEEEVDFLQGRLSSIETPRHISHEVTEPKSPGGRFHLPFSRDGKGPE